MSQQYDTRIQSVTNADMIRDPPRTSMLETSCRGMLFSGQRQTHSKFESRQDFLLSKQSKFESRP